MGAFPAEFTLHVHAEEDGTLWAEVLEMPGCFVSGTSLDEIRNALVEAIGLYLTSKSVTVKIHDLKLTPAGEDDTDGSEYRVKIPA